MVYTLDKLIRSFELAGAYCYTSGVKIGVKIMRNSCLFRRNSCLFRVRSTVHLIVTLIFGAATALSQSTFGASSLRVIF